MGGRDSKDRFFCGVSRSDLKCFFTINSRGIPNQVRDDRIYLTFEQLVNYSTKCWGIPNRVRDDRIYQGFEHQVN